MSRKRGDLVVKKKLRIALVAVAAGGIVAGIVAAVRPADAGGKPFSPIPAVGNIAAARGTPLFTTPAPVASLPPDVRPAAGQTHALGTSGYIWGRGSDGFCVRMISGVGGCFASFAKPVVMYLTGTQSHAGLYSGGRAEGVVPDSVTALKLHMSEGTSVAAPIAGNAFGVDVPDGVGIDGYNVELRDGRSFSMADPVTVPNFAQR
jgi:hypothetical protein